MKRLLKIFSKVMGIKEVLITEKTSKEDTPAWDSFNSLMLVSEIESAFNIKFSIQEAVSIKSVKDIKNILEKHGIILI